MAQQNISGFGLRVILRASNTFPVGLVLTQFADDTDPLDIATQQVSEAVLSLNGDLVNWSTANPVPMELSLIPGSEDDRNLAVLLNANRVSAGKASARDIISATISYPNGQVATLSIGKIIDGPMGIGVASAGRFKTRTYSFMFETQASN